MKSKIIKSVICMVPVIVPRYEGGYTTEYFSGEYTGYSPILKKHCFSLYNGNTVRLNTLDNVQFKNNKNI